MTDHPESGKEKKEPAGVPQGPRFGRSLASTTEPESQATLWWVFAISCIVIALSVAGWFYYEGLTATRLERNEATAIETLRGLTTAAYAYAERYGQAPPSLAALGPPAAGAEASAEAAGLIDAELAGGVLSGYRFTYQALDTDEDGTADSFQFHAAPVDPDRSGIRHFLADASGAIRESLEGPATASSPMVPGIP
jgi:hypothetical protein